MPPTQEELLEKLLQDVQEIKTALLGNAYHQNGIVTRLEAVEKRSEQLHHFKNKMVWQVSGISSAIMVLAAIIKEITNLW